MKVGGVETMSVGSKVVLSLKVSSSASRSTITLRASATSWYLGEKTDNIKTHHDVIMLNISCLQLLDQVLRVLDVGRHGTDQKLEDVG